MTNYRNLKNMNIDELASWLDENGQFDGSPWSEWFNSNYCKKCIPIKCKIESTNIGITPLYPSREIECAYCEINSKCKYIKKLDNIPTNKDIIKMWLKSKMQQSE